ncbi:hypothetical protein ACYF6T_10040 [Streptomyces sp. 7R007]
MVKNSRRNIALWAALGVVLLALAVSLLVSAVADRDGGGSMGGGRPSTSWYTEEPTAGAATGPGPAPVVTQTVVAVSPGGGGGGGSDLMTSLGSLLSGLAAVGTLLHAVQLSRQNRESAHTAPTPRQPSADG